MNGNLNNKNGIIISVDFDGTCVSHEFPNIGKDIGAVPVLKALVENGHQLVLFTMRSDDDIGDDIDIIEPVIEEVITKKSKTEVQQRRWCFT